MLVYAVIPALLTCFWSVRLIAITVTDGTELMMAILLGQHHWSCRGVLTDRLCIMSKEAGQ